MPLPAFDAVVNGAVNVSSWSHTCSGSQRLLVVFTDGPSGAVTGVTFNGVALTNIASATIANAVTGRTLQAWYLINPASGAHTVALSGPLTTNYIGISQSYTGCNQTSQPDAVHATGNSGTATSRTETVTTVADNSWLVFATDTNGGNSSAGTGAVRRSASASFAFETFDSNGPITPAASASIQATSGGAVSWASLVLSIAPAVTALTLTATQGQTATIVTQKITAKTLTATQGQTATIVTQRTKPKTLSASSTVVATIQRQIAKILRAVQAQAAALATTIIWVNPAWTYISVNAVARAYGRSSSTSKVFASSLRITDTINETPTRANFVAAGWIPAVGNDVVVALGGISNPTRLFGGVVLNVRPSSVGTPSNAVFDVQATDYTWLMDQEPFFGFFQSQTVATIAAALIAAAPGFTVNVAADVASIVIDEISFTNQPVRDCFSQLMTRAGGYWFCDYFKVAQLFGSYNGRNPTPLNASYPLALGLENFRLSSALDQVITRQYSEGGGGKALASVNAGETVLPLDDVSFYLDGGGSVTIKQQRGVTYTGRVVGGGGSLVGPGASPASAPALALAAGTGMGLGVYKYAYTDITAAGESLPSPLATVTTGTTTAPAAAPTVGVPTAGAGVDDGSHDYEVTFVTASGETTTSPVSSPAVVGAPSVAPSWAVGVTYPPSQSHGGLNNAFIAYSFLYAGGFESAASPASNLLTVASNKGWTATIPTGGSAVIGRRIYMDEGFGVGYQRYQDLNDNTTTAISNTSAVDSYFYVFLEFNGSPGGSAVFNQVPLTNIPVGSAEVTSRKLYRRFNGSGTFKLVTTLADNTTRSYTDTTLNASLGAAAPSSNTATAQRVAVSGIAIGASPTTSRKVYRTAVGGSQLKLLTTIANNTATTFADSTADGSLGANAPTGDTSGLTQPSGQVLAGAASLLVAGAGAFPSSGAWAIIGNGQQAIRYTGVSGNTLTGIPATGPGAITATVSYNSTVTVASCLVGIPTGGTGSLAYPVIAGDDVNLLVQEDDLAAQATLAALLSVSLPGSTGIKSSYITDGRISYTEARARAVARLAASRQVDTTIWYDCRDTDTQSGATISVNLLDAPGGPVVGDFTIQVVQISLFSATAGKVSPLYPTYSVEASTRRFSLEDLLRRALAAAA
jgi:hypothetical protein